MITLLPPPPLTAPRTGSSSGSHRMSALSVIIVSFNTRELTLDCLRSLKQHEPLAEVVVVDNASSDGSVAAIAIEFPQVRLLQLSANIGFGRASNLGLKHTSHSTVVLLNSDTRIDSPVLSQCAERLATAPGTAAVSPRLFGDDGVEQASQHPLPTFAAAFRRALGLPSPSTASEDYWLPGTCLVLRREAIESIGGLFDPQLFMYWEDADLCARLRRGGWQLERVCEAAITHYGGASGGGPNCTAKAGLHAWYTFGRHHWFARHRPRIEGIGLWGLEFLDAFRCLARATVRSDRRYEWQYGLTLLRTLTRRLAGLPPRFAITDLHGRRDQELILNDRPTADEPGQLLDVGAVVIGRNEGIRLQRCLDSLLPTGVPIVYVDSGSTDGSQTMAQSRGVTVVALDMTQPFTAARARNAGLQALTEQNPSLRYVQFVDGDCTVQQGWLTTAKKLLASNAQRAIVCGGLRERHPEHSVYNRLCQLEWRRPQGSVAACGGIFLGRIEALKAVGGFNEALIAGEEPELCLRLRLAHWVIESIPLEMAEHDAAMTHFGQWWQRSLRSGHAYAAGHALHGNGPQQFRRREVRSIVCWGFLAPILAVLTAWMTQGVSLVLLLLGYLHLYQKVRQDKLRSGECSEDAAIYARYVVLGKFPQAIGMLQYYVNRFTRRTHRIIEYK